MNMRKKKSLLRLVVTFLVTGVTLFGYLDVYSETDSVSLGTSLVDVVSIKEESHSAIIGGYVNGDLPVEKSTNEVENVDVVVPTPVVETSKVVETPVVVSPTFSNSISVGGIMKPLMKDENGNHYYLNHNLNGVYDGIGVPYIDYRNDFTGRKTILYSHSSTYGNGPFQVLQNYHNNYNFYNNNRYIDINFQGNQYRYLIFSVYVSVADSEESEGLEYFHRMNYSDLEWEETLQKYKSRSDYDTGVSVNANDKIIILQTCSMDPNYYAKYYRYNLLVMGKLI